MTTELASNAPSPVETNALSEVTPTPLDGIAGKVQRVRTTFDTGVTQPIDWRLDQLATLRRLLTDGESELLAALHADLRKPPIEAWATDLAVTIAEIDHTMANLRRWMRPRRVRLPLATMPARARVVSQPLGVAAVIAPWNYPVQLLVGPMAAALAAGNTVVGKPSELAPNVATTLGALFNRFISPDAVQLVQGGVAETTELLEQRFDHILYTGNGRVGRVVMAAAANHLTPVTLELGGKSPAIVTDDADINLAARRITWGKYLNAGQTCIAPDYVLVDRKVADRFTDAVTAAIAEFYGPDPKASPDYARIVNDTHLRRLEKYLDDGDVVTGGHVDPDDQYLAPTVLRGVAEGSAVMTDEIFGPVLPIVEFDSVADAIGRVNTGDKPLALYVFSRSRATVDRVLGSTSSGGACVNHVIYQVTAPQLPFGGVGPSGMGAYHGRSGFDTFSHQRSVMHKAAWIDAPVAYPPFTSLKNSVIRRFL